MKIVITGANGYLGSQLIKSLINKHKVACLVRRNSDKHRLFDIDKKLIFEYDGHDSLDTIIGSINPDVIINTVALYGRNNESSSLMVETNISYPIRLLELSDKYKVKAFINTGTSLPDDISIYSITKNVFTKLAFERKIVNTKFINIELEQFYGPKDDLSKFPSYVMNACINDKPLNLTLGEQKRDFIFISDVVSGYETIIDNMIKINDKESFPLGSGKAITIKEFVNNVKAISRSCSEINFGAVPYRNNEVFYSCANIRQLESLGWKCETSIEDGLNQMITI